MSVGRAARVAALVGAPILLIGALAWPLLFTSDYFNEDWAHHLWFMWNQSFAIRDYHHPSFFLNTAYSVFYPEYAFYSGTLDVLGAVLSLILGNAPIEAYVLAYLLGFACSYGGWYWLARAANLKGWWAHVPSVIFITSAYYLTLVYARGDLPEFLGVSTIPLMVAAALSVLRADRLRIWPALALAGSAVVFFGSHTLTIVWGSTFLVLIAALVLVCIPQARQLLTRRGVLRVIALVLPALLVSAWFLLPAAAYESHTQISVAYPTWRLTLRETMSLVSARNLFAISRTTAVAGSEFVLSLPVLAMAWSLVCVVVAWRRGSPGTWARLLLISIGMISLAIVVMTNADVILALPRPYAILQYTYRLEAYVMLSVSGAVLVGLVEIRNRSHRVRHWAWVLVPVLVVAIAGAIQQASDYPHGGDRQTVIESRTRSEFTKRVLTDYTDARLPTLTARSGRPAEVIFPATAIRDDRISKTVNLKPGEQVYSNLGGGPELVHVAGAKIVGVSPEGNDVLEIGPGIGDTASGSASGNSKPTEVITVSTASGWPVVLGRILSLAGLLFLVGMFAALVIRHLISSAHRPAPRAR